MTAQTEYDHSEPEVMLAYYRRLYPFNPIFNWLNHDHIPSRLFTHREFAFSLPGDVYIRYNSFSTAEDLKAQICKLNPTRFEIGPIYSARPRDKKTVRPGQFQPLLRELVFDIDMTDYDPIRTCCSDASICNRCWAFIAAAVRVLDRSIRDQFGYEQLLWVYSGRRGIHLWISDKEAMELTDQERKAIIGWMTVINGGKDSSKRLKVRIGTKPLPAPLKDAYRILRETFTSLILKDQDLFSSQAGFDGLLEHIPDEETIEKLKVKRKSCSNSQDIWVALNELIENTSGQRKTSLQNAKEDIILYYTYPRLDAEVSKHRNHLLKAPFCIHPKTGRVCVPVDPANIDEFDPETVPTVAELLTELDSLEAKEDNDVGEHHSDWEKTSLKPYVDMLNHVASSLMDKTRLEKRTKETLAW